MASIYGFEYIAGYTDSGVPYGNHKEQEEMNGRIYNYGDDEIPF